ncbi:IS630 family transposase [Streptomyces actuosus]|uniref:IS630 family transposase n=1 Tax=Streptomyces actuosus TaxID=1885 RepID=A0ABS2W148_STRAS|nr:IS630 family transposase [Streptomyces actuosus]
MADGGKTADELGAYVCFADEAGQALSPPRGRTWARRGARPQVKVHVRRRGRVNVLGAACFRPGGGRARFVYRLLTWRGRKGERKSFGLREYRVFLTALHQQLRAPVVLVWDNINVHKTPELTEWMERQEWLRVFHLPRYAPELNAVEGVWSLLKRSIVNFLLAGLDELEALVRSRLKQIQYRPDAIIGCLTETGLTFAPP